MTAESATAAATLGQRLRALRTAKGLSQVDLAGAALSASYVSLIESDRRSPEPQIVEQLAQRLGTTVEYLLTGHRPQEWQERQLRLKFAELALANGAVAEARRRFEALVHDGDLHLRWDAQWGLVRADEALGHTDAALDGLELLIDAARRGETVPVPLLPLQMTQCRLLADSGDFGKSVEIGEKALDEVRELGLESSEDAIRLASTLVGAYWGRGDLVTAQRLANRVIDRAERNGSRRSRGSAYWNAALVAEARGDAPTAIHLADRALGLLAEDDTDRSLARLRLTCAWLQMRAETVDMERTEALLKQAHETLARLGDSPDLAACETELARFHDLRGDHAEAISLALRAIGRSPESVVESGRARLVLGLAMTHSGDVTAGRAECRAAAEELEALGARMEAAQAWYEVAELAVGAGQAADAAEAFRRVAGCAGVRAPAP